MVATPTTNNVNGNLKNGREIRPGPIAQLLAAEEIGVALMARVEPDLADNVQLFLRQERDLL